MTEAHFVLQNGEEVVPPEMSFSDIVAFDRRFKPLTWSRYKTLDDLDKPIECALYANWVGLVRVGEKVPKDFDDFVAAVKDFVPSENGQSGKVRSPKKVSEKPAATP